MPLSTLATAQMETTASRDTKGLPPGKTTSSLWQLTADQALAEAAPKAASDFLLLPASSTRHFHPRFTEE